MSKVNFVFRVIIVSMIGFTILISSGINGYCEEKELYAPGEVIVKLREKETSQLLFRQEYSERKTKLADTLLRLKAKYNLRDEIPVFETLHKELEVENFTLQELEEKFRAKFPRRSFPKKRKPVDLLPIYLLKTDRDVLELCAELNQDPEVEYAQLNYIMKIVDAPNDPRYDELWGIKKIQCEAAWDITEGLGAVVCINDTGIDYNHEDLKNNMWTDENGKHGYDFYNDDSDPMDDHNHGTHCAGTVAAVGNNSIGVIGVGPKIKLMATKGLSSGGSGTSSDLAEGIRWATDHGADVVSNSWGPGGRSPSDPVCEGAVDYAYERGVVCVFAAGNANDDVQYYSPANYERTIAVAATDSNDEKASFSNYGSLIDVCAPGVGVLSTVRNNGYASYSGTSMACPHTAGVCGLLKSIRPGATYEEVRQIIREFSDDIGTPGKDNMGYGRVNAYLAVKGMAGNIKLEITSPPDKSYIRGNVGIYGSAYSEGDFQKYELYYAPSSDPEALTLITSSTIPIQDGLLAWWDTNQCPEGEKRLIVRLLTADGKMFQRYTRVNVDNRNDPPTFTKMPDRKLAIIGRLLEFKVEAYDPDDPSTPWGQLTYSANNLPSGAQFNPQTQVFSWTPSLNDKGTHTVTFIVRDSAFTVMYTINLYSLYIQEVRITTESTVEERPDIHKGKIVWQGSGIHMYDLSTNQRTTISSSGQLPAISGDKIVWVDGNSIYMYDLSTDQKRQVTDSGIWTLNNLAIYGDKIVWEENFGIYLYNLTTNQKIQLANSQFADNPAIHENKIVWDEWPKGIYLYDASTGKKEVIIPYDFSMILDKPIDPDIYENKVVHIWSRSSGIYMYDLSTAERVVVSGFSGPKNPRISKDMVVWEGNSDIYLYDLPGEQEIQITANSAQQKDAAADENDIVWADNRNGNFDIYLANLFYSPVIDSVNPTVVAPGELLTITGSNFGSAQGDSRVLFANGALGQVETWSNTKITCRVPSDAQTGLLKVVTPGGESNGVTVTISQPNRPPVLAPIGNKQVNEGVLLTFNISASDPDGDNLTYSASNLPQGATFNPTTKTFSWTPNYQQAGVYPNVHFEVTDGALSDSEDITITVNNVIGAPVLDPIGNKSVNENTLLTFRVNATDPEGDPITYSAQDLPTGAIFQNQTFTWTPTASDVGSHEVTFIASDGSLSDSEKIVIEVKLNEEIKVKIKFNTDRISKIGILYISGETNEGAVIKEVKVLNESNKILDIDMKDKVIINGEKYITGIVIVMDIIKKYPLLSGIKVRLKVAMGEKTKEGETGVATIEPYAAGPDRIGVYNNVFNPLNGEKVIIKIDIAKQTHIKINLYDTKGKKIKELADEERDAGMPRYEWDGKDGSGNVVGSGSYFAHIEAGDYKETKKIVVVK
jgi:thermitase